jgi:CRP/FNR family transcriptional regulator, cyclic AMP receptor protein
VNDSQLVSRLDILSKLPTGDRAELESVARLKTFDKNDYIFRAASPGNNVYILTKGRVKIFQLSPTGRKIILWFCFPGEMFGMAETSGNWPREVYAQACTDTEVLSIYEKQFKTFLATHPDSSLLTIDVLACRLRVLGEMLLNVSTDNVTTRLVKLITRLSALYGKRQDQNHDLYLDIPLTHQEIADMIGTSRQTVTTELGHLQKQGLVRMESQCLHIQNPKSLAGLIKDSEIQLVISR